MGLLPRPKFLPTGLYLWLMKKLLFVFILFPVICGAQVGAFKLGSVEQIRSTVLSETRTLNIYLPDGYSDKDTTSYPVIYLLDGGADEDFIHVAGLVQFCTFPWVKRLPPSIVVGIANTHRERDMTFPTTIKGEKERFPTTGGSTKFISFIADELQPYITKQFHTNGQTTIIGESLAGLLATEVLFTRPSLFDKYIIISPSLWWDNGSLLGKRPALPDATRKIGIYIGVGKEGLAPSEQPHVMEVDANLLADKLQEFKDKGISVYLDYLPDENHATIGHQAVYNAFKWLYRK